MKPEGTSPIKAYAISMALLVMFSCDSMQEEPEPFKQAYPTEFNTLPGLPVVINLRHIGKPSGADETYSVSEEPVKGWVSLLDTMLVYSPDEDFVGGADRFTISIHKSQTSKRKTISIHMQQMHEDVKLEFVSEGFRIGGGNTIRFLDEQTGFMETRGPCYHAEKTVDGGKTWTVKSNQYLRSSEGMKFCEYNRNIGFVVGTNYSNWIKKTTDQGETWQELNGEFPVNSIYPLPSAPGVVIASGPNIIIRSEDYGDSWTPVFEGYTGSRTIQSCGDQYVYVIPWNGAGLISKDYGLSWDELPVESVQNINGMQGIRTTRDTDGNPVLTGYHTIYENDGMVTKILLQTLYAEDLSVLEEKLLYTLPFQVSMVAYHNGEPIFTGYSDKDQSPVLIYEQDDELRTIIFNNYKYNGPDRHGFPHLLTGISCLDGQCFLIFSISYPSFSDTDICGSHTFKLLKMTFQN